MKQENISRSAIKKFGRAEQLSCKITDGFNAEAIHEFRTRIKKLRAFFRLLNVELKDGKELKISRKLKAFYNNVGTIRNLQLQLENVRVLAENHGYAVAGPYMEYLQKIIEKWKTIAMGFRYEDPVFYKDKKKALNQLPEKLRKGSCKIFLIQKINLLQGFLKELPGDDTLHDIRKLLKDVWYNWTFIEPFAGLLPGVVSEENKIKSVTELLGLFLDKVTCINLLETYCRDCEENGIFFEKETGELQEIENNWKREKQELLEIIYLKFGLLQHLTPVEGHTELFMRTT